MAARGFKTAPATAARALLFFPLLLSGGESCRRSLGTDITKIPEDAMKSLSCLPFLFLLFCSGDSAVITGVRAGRQPFTQAFLGKKDRADASSDGFSRRENGGPAPSHLRLRSILAGKLKIVPKVGIALRPEGRRSKLVTEICNVVEACAVLLVYGSKVSEFAHQWASLEKTVIL